MIDHLYFSNNINDDFIFLGLSESKHYSKVMRNLPGSSTYVTDGIGNLYKCRYVSTKSNNVILEINSIIKNYNKRTNYLHIAISPTKNIKRIEWFIEKAVEIGIDQVTFIKTEQSERKNIKLDRINRISISAIKQSKSTFLPIINEMVNFSSFLSSSSENLKLIANAKNVNNHVSRQIDKTKTTCIVIGPEGGFTNNEIDLAKNQSFKSVSFGNSIMRTETAGVYACSIFNNAI